MIPLSVPNLIGNESKYLKECIESGWISSAGSFVNKFENSIKSYVNSKRAIACMNGTVGLHTALNVLGVNSHDIVLTTNLTFVATLNSIMYSGAEPILFDIDLDTWQIDVDLIEEWLSKNSYQTDEQGKIVCRHLKTKQKIAAIIPVHVLGGLVDMKKLIDVSKKYNIPVIEDSTEALGSYYEKKHAGTFGTFGVFSFNGNKIISTGGGGMIVTDNINFANNAKHITTTAKTNNLDYFHDQIGYNYRMVNLLAAIGVAQMENFKSILSMKRNIDSHYKSELKHFDDFIFQKHYDNTQPNCWLFTMRVPKMRGLLDFLNKNKIQSRPFWTPMNKLPMYLDCKYISYKNNTDKIFEDAISIPSSSNLSEQDQNKVIRFIKKYYN